MTRLSIFVLGLCCLFAQKSTSTPADVLYAAAPEERGQFHVGGKGSYNYGYNTGDGIAKVEVGRPDGSVIGSYRYFDPLGRQIVRSYIADNRGFRVVGNELPVAPNTPALGILDAYTLTGAVEGTQEFSTPNIVTNDNSALIFQNQFGYTSSLGPVDKKIEKASENEPSQYQQQLMQKHNDIIRQQEELIKKQEEQLAKLKSQQDDLLKQQRQYIENLQQQQQQQLQQKQPSYDYKQIQPSHQQVQQRSGGDYYSFWNNAFGRNSPYLIGDDSIKYDFPAGFTYNVNHLKGPGGDSSSYLTSADSQYRRTNKNPYTIGYRLN